jgi:type IV secretory pathway VirB10-like protein
MTQGLTMRLKSIAHLSLALGAIAQAASCSSPKAQPPSPTPPISITKPINKAKDTKTNVEQKSKDREKLNPEQPEPEKP